MTRPQNADHAASCLAPVKTLRSNVGYQISAVNGTTEFLNPRQVAGSLRSSYQSPFVDFAWTLHPGWTWEGGWNYYGYGGDSDAGPTSPRIFHANMVTLALHYEF